MNYRYPLQLLFNYCKQRYLNILELLYIKMSLKTINFFKEIKVQIKNSQSSIKCQIKMF